MYNVFDHRHRTLLTDFDIKDEFVDACVLSYLSYLDPELFFMKWNMYKDEVKDLPEEQFYTIREKQINKVMYGVTKIPTFYDGSINSDITRDAQAYLIDKNDVQYVTFRGSSSVMDFISDFDFLQVPLDGFSIKENIKVHRGFYMQFLSIKDGLFKDLDPSKKIVFCSHSLGAAISLIAALYYAVQHKEANITVITFGCPRTGNSGFVDVFRKIVKHHYRFVTEKDIVPLISVIFEYVHVDDAYCLQEQYICKETGDAYWPYRTFCALSMIMKPFYMHSYNTYLKLLMQNYKKLTIKNKTNS